MARLKALPPRLAPVRPTLRPVKAGDVRIRGNSLKPIRERIFTRDCGLCVCVRCQTLGEVHAASVVDHITPLWAGGAESDDNRQSMSQEHHTMKTAHEAACRARGAFEPWQG